MRLDHGLIRALLLALETGNTDLDIAGFSADQITYHLVLMEEGGLIEADIFCSGDGKTIVQPRQLSWKAHDFLAVARNDKVWNEAQGILSAKNMSVSFDLLQSMLSQLHQSSLALS